MHTARTGNVGGVVLVQLPRAGTTLNLCDRLYDLGHAACEAWLTEAELSAMGIAGEVTGVGEVVVSDKVETFAFPTESGVFDRQQHGDRVAVIELNHVDVGWSSSSHFECATRRLLDRGHLQARGVRRRLMCQMLAEPGYRYRTTIEPPGPLDACHNKGSSARHRHHDFQQMQRLRN
jgi:hypothetical protein